MSNKESIKDLLQGISEENADVITTNFEQIMKEKVSRKLAEMKKSIAKNMFKEETVLEEETIEVKPQGNKFKIVKLSGDFGDSLKVGALLTSTEMDDLSEMGIVIKEL